MKLTFVSILILPSLNKISVAQGKRAETSHCKWPKKIAFLCIVLVCSPLFGVGHLIAKKRLQAAENLKEKQEEL